ncbi:ankyrin-3 [Teleopsis dalmanni]|uniref:ankyrin-3 n=1 Tax=Teleopsis dalmanni TaxID=139649 RepID=UPI0018CEBE59|nr:ankyrin-3 [Teleopsis dalmanni]XP_037949422.1 ankyrin-3 [Teleopsis dalmanni]
MTLGEKIKHNGNMSTLATKNSNQIISQQNNEHLSVKEKTSGDAGNNANTMQADVTISFLRSARSGDLEKVLEFLETGQIVDINSSNANGLNALHLAAKDGYIDIVTELLRRGIKVDNATKKGNTALHIASLAGQKDVIKLLLSYNANVNVQSLNGFTPLYMAAQENHDACVRFLLTKGANPSLATEDGFTPLAVAMQQGHDKVVAVLLESDVRGKVRLPALHIAAKKNDVSAANLLLQNEQYPDIISKSGFTPLHIAAHYGNLDIANLLIERGANVNFTAKHNITPIHVACKWGKTNILQLLLSKNAQINAKTRDGLTPLHCASRSGHVDVIETLLNNNAPILSKTKNGLNPLHMAAQGEHDEAARILLAHKAPVDEVTVDYLTALHVAAHCGHVRVARLLLQYKADPNARALNGFTPLHIACKKNRIKVVELLLKHNANISATTESGLTCLHVASFMGCMNIVIYLLQHDANPDATTVRGETPLHLAARANQTDIIRILLRNGAQIEVYAREGQTPLHVASRLGNIDIIMLMLQHGANVNATTKDIYSPLHIAAKEGQEDVAQILIENNAHLNAITKKGFTPLHLAAKYGKDKLAALLISHGADINCQGKNSITPLHVACHYNHQNVVQLLLDKGASPHLCAKNGHSALHIAAKKNQIENAELLLQYGAEPDVRSKAGFSPLHLATQEGHIEIIKLLLEHKVDPNGISKNGLTPLHLCAQEDHAEVARVLLDHQARISDKTKSGYTPLHLAAHYGQINMVKFLLENDANVEMITNVGYTPLHQAAQQGHTMVINLLLRHKANPNAVTTNGHTALSIANSLGYVTAVETLKVVTEKTIENTIVGVLEEKYKVVGPELMHETFISDSEEEGDDEHLDHQQYKYMATDDLKTTIEGDHKNYDNMDNEEQSDEKASKSNLEVDAVKMNVTNVDLSNQVDNVSITRPPLHLGFLVSFLVDARGGSMKQCTIHRHSGVRIIVPPKSCAQPTRITCRYVKPLRVHNPPPLMEGEALVSRIIELSPVEAKFLGPVILEIPHFGALCDKEREIIVLRSDNGDSWREHTLYENGEDIEIHKKFNNEISGINDLHSHRVIRIVTHSFPHFFAVLSRIRQEVHAIGPDGGTVSSLAVPEVQAIFPSNALTKKIRVGLQAQPVDLNGCCKMLGQGVAVSPVVTVEPRRRKFHKPITLSIPAPKAYTQGMVNSPYTNNAPTLRLLCSITGGQNRAVWEDVTGSTPLTFVKDSITFTTTVSARFWLMDCRNISDASRMATDLYSYMTRVPFMVKFVVFVKRISATEAKLSVFCMTDDKEEKTLEQQEYFSEAANSREVEVLEDQDIYLEFAGNLVPVHKSDEQLHLKFRAFRENRLSFLVHIKDPDEQPFSRICFMNAAKVNQNSSTQKPICILNISLEGQGIIKQKYGIESLHNSINSLKHNSSDIVMLEHTNLPINSVNETTTTNDIQKAVISISEICNLLESDWFSLAKQLGVSETDIDLINNEYSNRQNEKPFVMLRLWLRQQGKHANGNTLEQALRQIGRSDIVDKCICNFESVTNDTERNLAEIRINDNDLNFTEYTNNSIESKNFQISNSSLASSSLINTPFVNNEETQENNIESYEEKCDIGSEIFNKLKTETPVVQVETLQLQNEISTPTKSIDEQQNQYDIDVIRTIAEEHTRQVLQEAQQNIEKGSLPENYF